jgi:CRISPR-associated protein Cas1
MQLVINNPGSYIRKRGECFLLKNEDEELEVSVRKVKQLLITAHVMLTSDVVELAIENNIDIIFLNYYGKPYGRVWHSKLGSINTIRRKQLFLEDHPYGLLLVKSWISTKIENQIKFLNKLAMNRRDERKHLIVDAVIKLKEYKGKIGEISNELTVNKVRGSILGYEGSAGRVYFSTLGNLLPKKYQFEKRRKHPALDPFNCMLNYCYGILYSNVEKACMIAGLDPYIGIMHSDNYNKKSLVYDLVEMYRAIMDELVFKLFSQNRVTDDCFDIINDKAYVLNKEGKKLIIEKYHQLLEKSIRHDKRNIKLGNIIQYDLHKVANEILRVNIDDNLGNI